MATKDYTTTKDGIEMQFGTNHVGHFLLTNLLMPKLAAADQSARIVNVSSFGYMSGGVRFDDSNFQVSSKHGGIHPGLIPNHYPERSAIQPLARVRAVQDGKHPLHDRSCTQIKRQRHSGFHNHAWLYVPTPSLLLEHTAYDLSSITPAERLNIHLL